MAIFVADYETFRLVPVLATGPDRDEIMADSMSLDAGITGWAFAKGTPQNIPDTSKHPLARQIPGTSYVEESLLLVPLVATEHKLGIINCWRVGVGQFRRASSRRRRCSRMSRRPHGATRSCTSSLSMPR